jgi:hypothetical protein
MSIQDNLDVNLSNRSYLKLMPRNHLKNFDENLINKDNKVQSKHVCELFALTNSYGVLV